MIFKVCACTCATSYEKKELDFFAHFMNHTQFSHVCSAIFPTSPSERCCHLAKYRYHFFESNFCPIFHEMNLKMFKMFTDKGFQDVNNACSSDKVSI